MRSDIPEKTDLIPNTLAHWREGHEGDSTKVTARIESRFFGQGDGALRPSPEFQAAEESVCPGFREFC